MAAKKEPSTVLEELKKSGVVKMGNDPSLVLRRLPIGLPMLDDFMGGGMPLGRCMELYGPESTGKTLICQYAAAAVQKTERPLVLNLDLERSYDQVWWAQSGVDTSQLLVSSPPTAEKAIDIIVGMLTGEEKLGLIILDSIPGMVPAPVLDAEKSAEDNQQPGLLAKRVSLLYYKTVDLLAKTGVTLITTNQMRDNLGGYDELQALPGGKAQRHYNQIIYRTKRTEWIKESGNNIGFVMEITQRKNKTCSSPDGSFITMPFYANGQIDLLMAYIEDAIKHGLIEKRIPYYNAGGKNILGMANLREFYKENPEELELLKVKLAVHE